MEALLCLLLSMLALSTTSAVAADGVSVQAWGTGGALLYTLKRSNISVSITDWGATLTSFILKDKTTGKDVDIVLGFDTLEPYMNGTSPYFGTTVGRVANRIKDGRFDLNGTTYNLTINDNGNTLHGGIQGYNKMFWRSKVIDDDETPAVQFLLYSYDMEQGFPGDIDISVTYTLSSDTEMRIDMEASPRNKATPINLAHHSYWNLAGHSSGHSILNHTLSLWGSHYTPVNKLLIPTGEIASVVGTPFDFLEAMSIGSRIKYLPFGYDHNYALDGYRKGDDGDDDDDELFIAAKLEDKWSGRKMELWTNQVGVQFYSGNQIERITGKDGFVYTKYGGIALETQGFPNAVNQPNFPNIIVSPPQVYRHVMLYKFA